MIPAEKMARRLLNRHNLEPPYDLKALVKNYATVEEHHFPIEADGITIGIGGENKPQILINSSAPNTRKKFTLAHELGHIIIPWHTGTIVSHIDSNYADIKYSEMESEANRFAAELLIPRSWLRKQEEGFVSVQTFIKNILDSTETSRDAVLIKVFNTIMVPIICAQIDANGKFIRDYRTNTAPKGARLNNRNLLLDDNIFVTASLEEEFWLGDRFYKAWIFDRTGIEEIDTRAWREILDQILEDTKSKDLKQNVNAVLASKYNLNKDKSEQELCSLAMQAYDGRNKYDDVVAHPLFPQYVVKRIKELITKNKAKNNM